LFKAGDRTSTFSKSRVKVARLESEETDRLDGELGTDVGIEGNSLSAGLFAASVAAFTSPLAVLEVF
jgi:hypothetical protein